MNQFFKLKAGKENIRPDTKKATAEFIPLSTMDFFDRFVRQANEKKLLKTPLPTPLLKSHILISSIQLLQASQLDKRDVRIEEDNYGGTIFITQRGLTKVQEFLRYRQQEKAATVIQKVWRGYRVRSKLKEVEPGQEHLYYEQYIETLSSMYFTILNANHQARATAAPTQQEVEFMKKLNHPETYRVCHDYLLLLAEMEENPRKQDNRMTILPGNAELQNTMLMYQEYAPKVLAWISKVLNIQFKPNQDFLFIMRSGDLLCRLACVLYQNVECHLLEKRLEFAIHKIIFFLELCKSLHIKRSLLFKVSDILVWPDQDPHRKHALIVLRTIIALEKHARKSGWIGPSIDLRQHESLDLGVVSRESMIRKVQSSEAYHKDTPKGGVRRPSVPISFNAPPPPAEPPTTNFSRSVAQHPNFARQRSSSLDNQTQEYQPRRKSSKVTEFEPVAELPEPEPVPETNNLQRTSTERFEVPKQAPPMPDNISMFQSMSRMKNQDVNRQESPKWETMPRLKMDRQNGEARSESTRPDILPRYESLEKLNNKEPKSSPTSRSVTPSSSAPSRSIPNSPPLSRSEFVPRVGSVEQMKRKLSANNPNRELFQREIEEENIFKSSNKSSQSGSGTPTRLDFERQLEPQISQASFSADSLFSMLEYLTPGSTPTSAKLIPQATQIVGQNYEDSSDEESFSDQLSEFFLVMRQSLSLSKPINEETAPKIDQKQILQDAIRQRIAMRSKNINEFMEEEQTYMTNLSNVADYLSTLIKKRRRASSLIAGNPDREKSRLSFAMNTSLTEHAMDRLPNETERAYKYRLESESEELMKLLQVIETMVELQREFLENLQECWDEESNTFLIGDVVSSFIASLNRPYTTYAVVALSGVNKAHLTLTTRGEVEQAEFVNRIVNRYVSSALHLQQTEEPSEQDWGWFLKRPIHRLRSYPTFFSIIHGEIRTRLHPLVDQDNKKLRIASIKIECIANAIEEHLNSK